MATIETSEVSDRRLAELLMALVAPRPIALVATRSCGGVLNIAPFSFFNICSVRPPIVMFSSLRRMRDGTVKDTERNLLTSPECTIQIVTEDLIYAQNIAAVDFMPEVNEFEKAGLTSSPSKRVGVPLAAEAPLKLECKVVNSLEFGQSSGSARVFFCEILLIHIDDKLLGSNGSIDTGQIRYIGRQSGARYCRSYGNAVFDLPIPKVTSVVGVDGIPAVVKARLGHNATLIARLGASEAIPRDSETRDFWHAVAAIGNDRGSHRCIEMPDALFRLVAAIATAPNVDTKLLGSAVQMALDMQAYDLAWYLALRDSVASESVVPLLNEIPQSRKY